MASLKWKSELAKRSRLPILRKIRRYRLNVVPPPTNVGHSRESVQVRVRVRKTALVLGRPRQVTKRLNVESPVGLSILVRSPCILEWHTIPLSGTPLIVKIEAVQLFRGAKMPRILPKSRD